MSFPFDLHSTAVFDSHLSCRARAIVLKATAQHGRRETASSRSASSGYHAEFHEVVIRCISIPDAGGQCENKHRLHGQGKDWQQYTKKKKDSVGLAVRIFPSTMRTFTKDTAPLEQGTGAAWLV